VEEPWEPVVEALVITWRELLIVALVVLGVYAAQMLVLLRWSSKRGANAWKRPAQATPAETQRLNAVSLEVAELRKQVARLESEVEKLRPPASPASSPYNQAIHMARQGASASDVASTCGISRGEAELIVALYRRLRI
jgi:outer membrane murein-binding lipoprotein Lpp